MGRDRVVTSASEQNLAALRAADETERKAATAAKEAADAKMVQAHADSYLDFDDIEEERSGSSWRTGGLKFEKSTAETAAETSFDDTCEFLAAASRTRCY